MKEHSSFVPPLQRKLPSPTVSRLSPSLPTTTTHAPLYHRAYSLPPLQSARLIVATASSAVMHIPRPVVGFVHLFLSFLAGGIFFGALFAGVTTFVAVGKSNLSLLWSIALSVISRVWHVFLFGLNETRLALRMDGKWQWREAWKTFKSKMGETRQAAAEGMDAIMQEKQLYAGVVGEPGLITAQYFLDRLLPFSLTTQMENALENSLENVKNDYIQKVTLEDFSTGGVSPELMEARAYDLGKDALAFDIDVKWESKVNAKMKVYTRRLGIKVPVKVRNPTFQGTARVVLSPLTKEPPGWGAILVSLASVPKITLDIQAAGGDMTKVPWLKKEIMKGLEQQIENNFLWPKRLVLPSLKVNPKTAPTVIPKKQLDALHTTDPLLQKETELEKNAALKDHASHMKPNVTEIPSSLKVLIGDGNTTVAVIGADNSTVAVNGATPSDVKPKKEGDHKSAFLFAHKGNKTTWLNNLMPHYKNSTKTH